MGKFFVCCLMTFVFSIGVSTFDYQDKWIVDEPSHYNKKHPKPIKRIKPHVPKPPLDPPYKRQ